MFSIFKKKSEQHELTEQISVDNLQAYVVQGYEKEKQLQAKVENLKSQIDVFKQNELEHDALKVVLREKESEISKLKAENEQIEAWQSKYEELQKRFNNLRISKESLLKERDTLEEQMREVFTADAKNTIAAKVLEHKGNLSKAAVLEMIEEV